MEQEERKAKPKTEDEQAGINAAREELELKKTKNIHCEVRRGSSNGVVISEATARSEAIILAGICQIIGGFIPRCGLDMCI